jgi:hypothetical protein
MATPVQVVFDCADPDALARFWAAALGYVVQPPPDGYASWQDWLREHGIPEDRWNDASAAPASTPRWSGWSPSAPSAWAPRSSTASTA